MPDHLQQLYDETCEREHLDQSTRQGLHELLVKHAEVFATDDSDLGRTNIVELDIDAGSAKPIRQPPRRVPTVLRGELDTEIKEMLKKGVIERGQIQSFPGCYSLLEGRFAPFLRRLPPPNAVTEFDAYPLPRIDETLEALSGAKFFSTLDLISGYWQVGLTPEARLKSTFCVHYGLYLWNVMPFGLCNAPGTFECLMESVLHNLHWLVRLV